MVSSSKKTTNRSIWLVLLLVVAGAIYLLVKGFLPATPGLPPEVSIEEASNLRTEGAFFLDVRQPEEWESGHIPGATLLPLGEITNHLSEIPDDQPIVVVCRSGNRSAQGRDLLKQAGYSQVTSMWGGMNEWIAAGYPSITGP
jgi:rhodanese-related sulfurtransferase